MDTTRMFLYLLIMAGVTYLIRMLPFVLFRRNIKSPFLKSFFHYIPYAVLGAMTVPGIFYSTASLISAAIGFAVAVILAWRGRSLLTVALAACAAAYIVDLLQTLL